MHLVVFGGSFDPIHHGHLIVAGVAAEALGADQVRLVPVAEQPFKVGRHRAAAAHRLRMVELGVEDSEVLVADRSEVDRPGPSFTVDTLRAFAERFPGARLTLALGVDAAELFGSWREPAEIRRLAELALLVREGESIPDGLSDRVVMVPRIDISSTEVRERVRLGRSIRYWVPAPVDRYIAAHGLYREA